MMKQCTTLTPLENEVVEILSGFPTIRLYNLESGFQFPFTWGRKRLRSAICESSSSLSPSLPPPKQEQVESPATPFSFSYSESEDKRTLFRKNVSLKRKKDHYLKINEDLTKENELLHGEVKNVKCHLGKLKELNLKLKARKQELSVPKAHQSEILAMVRSPPFIGETKFEVVAIAQCQVQQETTLSSSKCNGGNNISIVGPIGIPDLNLMPNEEQLIMEEEDLSVVQNCKEKNHFANTKH